MGKVLELTGMTFGRWTVIDRAENSVVGKCVSSMWNVRCQCGSIGVRQGYALAKGKTSGCLRCRGNRHTKHGHCGHQGSYKTKTYNSWIGMKSRCYCKGNIRYSQYGGRGITVCDRWTDNQKGFLNFLEDMGERPEGRSLDRKRVDVGYSKENCRWATAKEQRANQRKRTQITGFTNEEIKAEYSRRFINAQTQN